MTRPDNAFSVNQLSQFLHSPTTEHACAAKRILCYLKGTSTIGLPLLETDLTRLTTYADADWVGCPATRRSTTGYAVFLGSTLLSWQSKKQPTVSRSSTETEYRALAYAAAEIIWISSLCREIGLSLRRPLIICCDNIGATYLASNPIQHNRTKHVTIDYHFIREQVRCGDLVVKFVPTKEQRADIFTKNLNGRSFTHQRTTLMLRPEHEIAGSENQSYYSALIMETIP
ncbi:hypothetical protein MLD38_004775 [Melastoma candidum]|nr:hypothetical protein MLD38_004775 [Melastoma candidum]